MPLGAVGGTSAPASRRSEPPPTHCAGATERRRYGRPRVRHAVRPDPPPRDGARAGRRADGALRPRHRHRPDAALRTPLRRDRLPQRRLDVHGAPDVGSGGHGAARDRAAARVRRRDPARPRRRDHGARRLSSGARRRGRLPVPGVLRSRAVHGGLRRWRGDRRVVDIGGAASARRGGGPCPTGARRPGGRRLHATRPPRRQDRRGRDRHGERLVDPRREPRRRGRRRPPA